MVSVKFGDLTLSINWPLILQREPFIDVLTVYETKFVDKDLEFFPL